MKKRILSVLFIVALLVAALMVGAQAANADPDGNGCPHCTGTVTWTEWSGTAGPIADGGHYKLTAKASTTYLDVNGIDIVIDVNGFNLYNDPGPNGRGATSRILRVTNGGSATVIDSSAAQTGAISGTATMNGSAIFINNGTVNLYGGIVKCNSVNYANDAGGTVYITGTGVLNMYGGEIRATTLTDGDGGAIYTPVATTQVNISGGKVSGGTVAGEGAAIYANGQLNISGTAQLPTNDDSNVALSNTASLTLEGTPTVMGLSVDPACSVKVNDLSAGAAISLTTTDVTLAEANASLADYVAEGYITAYTPGKVLSVADDNKTVSGDYYNCPCCDTEPSQIVWTAWNGAPTESGHYYLGDDSSYTAVKTLPAGTYTLNLNGKTLNGPATGGSTGRFLTVSNATLNIVDSGVNGTISTAYTGGNGGIFNVTAGTLNLYDGTLQNTAQAFTYAGAVVRCASTGTVNVTGSAVIRSDAADAMRVAGGTVTISGAPTISKLKIEAGKTIAMENLTTGASIGIAADGAFTAAANNDAAAWVEAGYLTSNVSGKSVVAREGILYIEEVVTPVRCPHCGEDVQWTPWEKQTESGHYYLTAGYSSSQYVTAADTDVVLDLRGNWYTSADARSFVVKDGATFSLVNTANTLSAVSGGHSSGPVEVQADSTFNLYPGITCKQTAGSENTMAITAKGGTVVFAEDVDMSVLNGKIKNIGGYLEGVEGALLMDQQSANGGIWYQTAQEAADLFVDANNDFIRLMGAATVKATQSGTFFNINGHDLTVDPASTVPVKVANMKSTVTAVDPATVTADEADIQLVTPYTAKVQFVALPNGAGAYTVHRLELQLSYVTFRPAAFGFYYKATFNTDDILANEIDAYGVALSLNGVPDASVPTKTEMTDFANARGTDVKFGGLFGIMKSGNTPAQNATNGMQKVYANCYVKIGDMVILSDNRNVGKNANDAGFSGVGMSLFDVMQRLNGMTLEGEQLTAVETFKTDLANMGVQWPALGDTELSIVPLA